MYDASLSSSVYFELDITGNVRRVRGGKALSTSPPLASDLGGYRYTAFGHLNTTDTTTAYPSVAGQRYDQPLRWQSRWFIDSGSGSGLYDFRARVWSPELGAFLQPDEYGYLTPTGTLWSWPGQNPFRYRDPSGRGAAEDLAGEVLDALAAAADSGAVIAAEQGVAETPLGTAADLALNSLELFAEQVKDLAQAEFADKDAEANAIARDAANKECKADLHRPYLRKATRAEIQAAAPRDAAGRPIDPNTGQPIEGTPDIGHKPGNEFRREKAAAEAQGMSQPEFNDEMNDSSKYQLEDPSSNRSHKYEQP